MAQIMANTVRNACSGRLHLAWKDAASALDATAARTAINDIRDVDLSFGQLYLPSFRFPPLTRKPKLE
ncbi:hypothetical protein GGD50_002446 [Rhizobium paranaense]|uniref:Uncharacterized protein n=1 Tax=Rhizobium paranaense TaxID=1650438 RepID=A0A7W8XQP1_9HYPH|nr:hypothetical protein [Rhizobium paranaense]